MTTGSIVFVTPRYNAGSAGGAEVLCQALAQRLAATGQKVEVLTSCARDSYTWQNEFPEGRESVNGVTVHRFGLDRRDTSRHSHIEAMIQEERPLSLEEEETWLKNGVYSQKLIEHIKTTKDKTRCFILLPYLFGTTYFGALAAGDKAVILPCLHDEAFAKLKAFRSMLTNARGILFNAVPEMELARRLYNIDPSRAAVVGMGIDPTPETPDADRFRKKYKIDGPFIFYAGRREGGKNTPLLIEYFKIFRNNSKIDLKLVLAGSGTLPETGRDDIIDIGYIPEQDKADAMAAASIFCQPSVNESFSIVIMEAWLALTPALVSAGCPVTSGHCRAAGAGLYFNSYFEFEEAVKLMLENRQAAETMALNGKKYVESEYSWDKILTKFNNALERMGL